jgi:GAF domain-containing protein
VPATGDTAETISRLEAEVARLRSELDGDPVARRLRDALTVGEAAMAIAMPASHSELLQLIVETAASVISARAGALFLIDEEKQELYFEVAFGGRAERVKDIRVPLGHGIAGGVAIGGQALAVAHVQEDPRWAKDIGERVGYKPDTLLCVPLFYQERIIGVLELLDKEGGATFGLADVEALSLFANQAALAIEHSRIQRNAAALVAAMVIGPEGERSEQALGEDLRRFGGSLGDDPVFRDALELAGLLHRIVQQGETETEACKSMLRGFSEYVHSRRQLA